MPLAPPPRRPLLPRPPPFLPAVSTAALEAEPHTHKHTHTHTLLDVNHVR